MVSIQRLACIELRNTVVNGPRQPIALCSVPGVGYCFQHGVWVKLGEEGHHCYRPVLPVGVRSRLQCCLSMLDMDVQPMWT